MLARQFSKFLTSLPERAIRSWRKLQCPHRLLPSRHLGRADKSFRNLQLRELAASYSPSSRSDKVRAGALGEVLTDRLKLEVSFRSRRRCIELCRVCSLPRALGWTLLLALALRNWLIATLQFECFELLASGGLLLNAALFS